ncbi:site-specific integrase (plasmid) [Polaromonas sp. P1-6]|nr:site-specific integrase [Polaromonas sp. P1-6]
MTSPASTEDANGADDGEIAAVQGTARRLPGRPRGSRDAVIKGKQFSMDQYAAVRAYLMGVDPLTACKKYLLHDEPPNSTEEALSILAHLMGRIADQGDTRPAGPDKELNAVNQRAADALLNASQACFAVVKQAQKDRIMKRNDEKEQREKEAKAHDLKPLPLRGGPKPPAKFDNLKKFEIDYDSRHRLDDPLDPIELQAKFEDELSEWFASAGFYYKPQYAQNVFAQQIPMRATAVPESKPLLKIDGNVQAAASRAMGSLTWTVQRRPAANDHLKAWIGGTTLSALNEKDIFTLYSLIEHIRRYGSSWWKQVPGLGPTRAERLKVWLLEVGVQGFPVDPKDFESIQLRRLKEIQAAEKATGPLPSLVALDLTPLQPWIANEALNGRHGTFRRPEPNMLKASTDIDALIVTLNKYKDKPATLKVYAREMCRFCLWAFQVKALPLSSIGVEDAREYREFLSAIPDNWISTSRDAEPRGTKDWRPFRGQLTEVSQRKALTAISVIFKQLHDSGYLAGHPMSSVLKHAGLPKPKTDIARSLSLEQWTLMLSVLKTLEVDAEVRWTSGTKLGTDPRPGIRRTAALIHLLQSTGIRHDELHKARLGHIQKTRLDGHAAYMLTVTGKRAKVREVLLPSPVMELVLRHLEDRPPSFKDDLKTPAGKLKVPLISVLGEPLKAHQLIAQARGNDVDHPKVIDLLKRDHASPHGALSAAGMLTNLRAFSPAAQPMATSVLRTEALLRGQHCTGCDTHSGTPWLTPALIYVSCRPPWATPTSTPRPCIQRLRGSNLCAECGKVTRQSTAPPLQY